MARAEDGEPSGHLLQVSEPDRTGGRDRRRCDRSSKKRVKRSVGAVAGKDPARSTENEYRIVASIGGSRSRFLSRSSLEILLPCHFRTPTTALATPVKAALLPCVCSNIRPSTKQWHRQQRRRQALPLSAVEFREVVPCDIEKHRCCPSDELCHVGAASAALARRR